MKRQLVIIDGFKLKYKRESIFRYICVVYDDEHWNANVSIKISYRQLLLIRPILIINDFADIGYNGPWNEVVEYIRGKLSGNIKSAPFVIFQGER